MAVTRISWSGELTDEQGEVLNDVFHVMGLYQWLQECKPEDRERVQKEIDEIEAKYGSSTD